MCKSKGELSYQVQNYKTIKWHWEEIAHRRFTADFRRNLFAQRLKTFTERGIAVTKLYEILSKKVGKEEAEALTVFVEEKIVDEFEKNKSLIVTKHYSIMKNLEPQWHN